MANSDPDTIPDKLKPSALRERIRKLRMGTVTVQTSPGANGNTHKAFLNKKNKSLHVNLN